MVSASKFFKLRSSSLRTASNATYGQWIENNSDIEINAIGIGHDVTNYYEKAIKIADVQELGDAMVDQLVDLFINSPTKKRTLN